MLLVVQKGPRIYGIAQVVAIIALHVYGRAAKVPALHESSHAPCDMSELIVVSYGELEASLLRQCNECFSLPGIYRERLLHVNVAAALQASFGDLKVAQRGGRASSRSASRPVKVRCTGNLSQSWLAISGSLSQAPTISHPLILLICEAWASAIFPQPMRAILSILFSLPAGFKKAR